MPSAPQRRNAMTVPATEIKRDPISVSDLRRGLVHENQPDAILCLVSRVKSGRRAVEVHFVLSGIFFSFIPIFPCYLASDLFI